MHFKDLIEENSELVMRVFDYYEKSLEDLQENEVPNDTIPLLKDKVEDSILEIKLIKKLSNSGTPSDMEFVNEKMSDIYSILKFYEGELIEDIEEMEKTTDNNDKIQLLQEEIDNVNEILKKF